MRRNGGVWSGSSAAPLHAVPLRAAFVNREEDKDCIAKNTFVGLRKQHQARREFPGLPPTAARRHPQWRLSGPPP
eukprot:14575479-Heterocapsa_arctica.AAC.1